MIWRVFIVLALIAVAVISVLSSRPRSSSSRTAAAPPPPQPGYYMTHARITETGKDGTPLYRVDAARIQQDTTDNSVRLDDLTLVYHTEDERNWTLTATRGTVPPGSKEIDLKGNVRIVGDPRDGEALPVVRTERLRVDTEKQIATTQARVDLEMGLRRLSTMGLRADLKAGRLQLESSVHGRFVP